MECDVRIWLPAGIEICALQRVLYETFQTQFHIIFTGIEVGGRSLMTKFTDLHRMAPATFYNEGYESDCDSTPSQPTVHKQSSSSISTSSLSIAPWWNRSTFANSNEVPIESTQF